MLLSINYTTSEIVAFIVGIIILGFVAVFIWKKYKSIPDGEAKLQELFEFMQGIVISNIIEALEKLDIGNISKSIAEIEAEFIESMYEDIWDLFDKEIEKLVDTDNLLYTALRKAITREKVEAYVAAIFATKDIQDKFVEIYNIAISKKTEEIEKEDEAWAKEMEAYENDEIDAEPVETLNPMVDSMVPVEDQQIIPPSEEESESVSADDESVEILEEIPDTENSTESDISEATFADTESLTED